MKTPLLEIRQGHVFYGAIEALKGVSLTVNAGEIIALLGANGAGKTTTLAAIVGLVPPKSGQVIYDGQDIQGLGPEKLIEKGLILVPEGRRIFPRLTVLENLRLGAYHRADRQAVARDLESSLELFPILKTRLRQSGGTLSGGEQQMLAIARGLMGQPRLLLLDEPSLGLAPLVIKRIFETIAQINRERGTTIVLVEQNANLALRVANRAYILTTGRVSMSGTAKELSHDERVRKAYLGG
jgi:branched-chain amino acid transport system ATP-binding protein